MKSRYIFIKTPDGYCKPSGYTMTGDQLQYVGFVMPDGKGGKVHLYAKTSCSKVLSRPDVAILMNEAQFEQLVPTKKNLEKNNSSMDHMSSKTIILSETPQGKIKTAREETPYGEGGQLIELSLTLDYTNPAAGAPQALPVVMGDGAGIVKNYTPDSILADQIAAGLVIDGTHGANTLQIFNDLIKGAPLRLHTYQGEANNASYWTKGNPAQTVEAGIQGSLKKNNLALNVFQDGTQFNREIRQIADWRFIVSQVTALVQTVQQGDLVTLHFVGRSVGVVTGYEFAR